MFTVPDNVRELRDQVLQFVEERVYPHEAELQRPWAESLALVDELRGRSQGPRPLGPRPSAGHRGPWLDDGRVSLCQ